MSKLSSPKISVLIPVYNVETYLHKCLDSVIHQTLQEIEIICVDDGSTDNSGKICDEYAQQDSRISVTHKPHNEGLLLARKTAVMQATGDYICFLDSDDYLTTENSLAIILEEMLKDPVDILKFSVEVVDYSSLTEKQVYELKGSPLYCEIKKITGSENIISDVYFHNTGWTLWNKLYKRNVCLRAYHEIKNIQLVMAEDAYTYFLIAYHANSFRCTSCSTIYSYRLGSGISTQSEMPLTRYQQFVKMMEIPFWLEEFLHQKNCNSQHIAQTILSLRKYLYSSAIHSLFNLSIEDLSKGVSLLTTLTHLHQDTFCILLTSILYQQFSENTSATLHIIQTIYQNNLTTSKSLVIYNHALPKHLQRLLESSEIHIKPFCNEILSSLKEKINIVPIIEKRYQQWNNYFHTHEFGTIIADSNACYEDLLFDAILLKLLGKRLILIEKLITQSPSNLQKLYHLADKIVVPSLSKQQYYKSIGIDAIFLPAHIPGVLTYPSNQQPKTNEIVWVGFADTIRKYGVEFMYIIPAVLRFSPQSKFAIDSFSTLPETLQCEVLLFINTHHLSEHIVWLQQEDVFPHAQTAHILLVTSYPIHHTEIILVTKATGIPSIIGTETFDDNLINWQGSISIPYNNINELTVVIHDLTTNPNSWNAVSAEARSFFNKFYSHPEQHWREFLSQLPLSVQKHSNFANNKNQLIFWSNLQQLCNQGATQLSNIHIIKRFQVRLYLKYKILSKITWGNRKKYYQQLFEEQLKLYDLIRNPR